MNWVNVIGVDYSDTNFSYRGEKLLHNSDKNDPQIYVKLMKKFVDATQPLCIERIFPYFYGCKLKSNNEEMPIWFTGDHSNSIATRKNLADHYYSNMKMLKSSIDSYHSGKLNTNVIYFRNVQVSQ